MRVIVNLPDDVVAAVEILASQRSCTRTEVIRDAISNLYYLDNQVRFSSAKVLLELPDGSFRRLFTRYWR